MNHSMHQRVAIGTRSRTPKIITVASHSSRQQQRCVSHIPQKHVGVFTGVGGCKGDGARRSTCTRAAGVAIEATLPLSEALPFVLSHIYPHYLLPLLGGLTLGVLVVGQLIISGKVVGISGAVRGLVEGQRTPWRVLFVGGLIVGGMMLRFSLFPGAFGPDPIYTTAAESAELVASGMWRLGAAGLLVGVGTSLGNGCTSGHGICGNARLSLRSFISTCTFMLFGAMAAAALNTTRFEGLPLGFIVPPVPEQEMVTLATRVLGAAMAFIVTMASVTHLWADQGKAKVVALAQDVTDFGVGLFFALGLGISGMTQPSKVAGFLGILAGTFDASLMFVMGGALLLALPGYQYVLRSGRVNHPMTCSAFSLPTSKEINLQLVGGSAIFGLGWGLAGLCPGPGLVGLASFSASNLTFVGSMLMGMALVKVIQRMQAASFTNV
ncbi:hypothetical protein M9434_004769 [Picochlorum sp. BPE23]|nr:hypothetical protein M9434_004769 [Picochlorum sp. BPE23]